MLIVHVHVHVKPEWIDAFKQATLENARHSVKEAGIARFDILRNDGDRSRFVLVEVYRDAEATVNHKGTAHYRTWRDTVADMMAEPRSSMRYDNLFPPDEEW